MYPFTCPLSLACMLLRLVGPKWIRVGHTESRSGLATVRGWNWGRTADLLYPTPPHNSGMPTGPETKNNTYTHLPLDYSETCCKLTSIETYLHLSHASLYYPPMAWTVTSTSSIPLNDQDLLNFLRGTMGRNKATIIISFYPNPPKIMPTGIVKKILPLWLYSFSKGISLIRVTP